MPMPNSAIEEGSGTATSVRPSPLLIALTPA